MILVLPLPSSTHSDLTTSFLFLLPCSIWSKLLAMPPPGPSPFGSPTSAQLREGACAYSRCSKG